MVRLPSLPENLPGGLLGVHKPHWPSDGGWLSSSGVAQGGFPAPFDNLRWLARSRYYRAPPFPFGAAACLLRPNIAPKSSPPESCGGREETGGGKSRLDPGGGNGSRVAVTLDG
uniref:Uncharacterized protein n=1 Tax=Chromera velia CCMP2878 TaxID=1169474 RepID=A0A0G4HMM2_9ALVE|eukprot:Cvel_7527.t1-p1 / transcript=Cvel_7527.t1 / gene=Cvel_7527 / organism=Chromera_velia_CCMP2878 / gene_product=hypothetical protein / transcript_product=hypothetical protein / location=Cvel_scaffold395:74813-75590(+) / protein_length=113 / sequence_SO=supercontig / SO=protein_coding / is_pseudo=false